jgi:hypothetical protein
MVLSQDGKTSELDANAYAVDIVAGPPGARRLATQVNAVPPEHGWASLAYSVTVPAGSQLAFGIAKDAGAAEGDDGMAFRVRIEDGSGATETLFETDLEQGAPGMAAGWKDVVVPVDRYWGKPVTLRLEVLAGANNAHDFGFWGNPRFVIDDAK